MKNHKKHIEAVIEKTLSKLNSLYHRGGGGLEDTRLIFPRYWVTKEDERVEGELRVSEQELRFMFVEELNKYCDASFSATTTSSSFVSHISGLKAPIHE